MATGNSSFTKLITTTLQNHGREIFDAVSTNNALFFMLKKRGNIKVVSGGRTFTHPVYFRKNSSYGSIAKLGTIPTPLTDDITRAEYPIKIVAGSIVLSALEEAMNAGNKEQLIKLATEAKDEAKITMTEVMGDQVWKDGSVTDDFDGLQFLIPIDPTAATTIGGIDSSATGNGYWQSQVGDDIGAFNTGDAGITSMNALYNSCIFGSQGPTAVFTTKAIFGLYELSMTSQIRHLKTELGDTGFVHLAYKTLPILFDDNCPSGKLYMVDLNNLWLQLLARGNFVVSPFQQSINSLSRIALNHVFGNLTTGSLRTNGHIESVA